MSDISDLRHAPQIVDYVFFDSGTGGLPYMLHLKEKSPNTLCIYVADTRNFPYGLKSGSQITSCAEAAVRLILRYFKPRAVVIGCNTISVTALEQLRASFPSLHFVGTVPAIKQAASVTKNGRIGLLATRRTVDEPYTAELANRFAPDCTLITRADPTLIRFIEHDFFTASEAAKKAAVLPAVDFFAEQGVDTIILGCTHFLHMADTIAEAAGAGVCVVDSKEGVVNQALRVGLERFEGSVRPVLPPAEPLYPAYADSTFFITGPEGINEEPYKILSKKLNIPYGGILKDE
ncbi:glutamate racemase [Treponema sp. HNW]|uniref:glutamate racemase n=1 Tax=Treponema sp. HNW TaxID=3116654 RepID=UPI003D0F82DF